jgi:hypothetical protein
MKRIPVLELGIALVIGFMSLFLLERSQINHARILEEAVELVEEETVTEVNDDVFYVNETLYAEVGPIVLFDYIKGIQIGDVNTEHYLVPKRLSYYKFKQPRDSIINSLLNYRVERVDTLVEPSLHNTPYYIESYNGKDVPPEAKARSPGSYTLTSTKIYNTYLVKNNQNAEKRYK